MKHYDQRETKEVVAVLTELSKRIYNLKLVMIGGSFIFVSLMTVVFALAI